MTKTTTLQVSGELKDLGRTTYNKYNDNSLRKEIVVHFTADIYPFGQDTPLIQRNEKAIDEVQLSFDNDQIDEEFALNIIKREWDNLMGLKTENITIDEINIIKTIEYVEYEIEILSYKIGYSNIDVGNHSKKNEGFIEKTDNFDEAKKFYEIVKEKLNDGSPQQAYRNNISKYVIKVVGKEEKKKEEMKEIFF